MENEKSLGFGSVGRTNKVVLRCHFGLWEIVMSIFNNIDKTTDGLIM